MALLLAMVGCVNANHAEVRLAGNPAGADCFSRCVMAHGSTPNDVDCVASCPGAVRRDGPCQGGACVENRQLSTGKTALLVIGGAVLAVLLLGATSSSSDDGAGP